MRATHTRAQLHRAHSPEQPASGKVYELRIRMSGSIRRATCGAYPRGRTDGGTTRNHARRRRRYMDVIETHSKEFIDGVMASDHRVLTLTPDLEAYCIQMFAKVRRQPESYASDPPPPSSI